MGIFSKKPHYSFSDVIKGLQQAVNSAQEMLQAQQIQNLTKFWDAQNNAPLTQKVTECWASRLGGPAFFMCVNF